jgi:hypothetical protein
VLVLAGTGLKLRDSLKLVASAILKPEADMSAYLVVDFDMYDDSERMAAYMNIFFLIPSNDVMSKIFERITGNINYVPKW